MGEAMRAKTSEIVGRDTLFLVMVYRVIFIFD